MTMIICFWSAAVTPHLAADWGGEYAGARLGRGSGLPFFMIHRKRTTRAKPSQTAALREHRVKLLRSVAGTLGSGAVREHLNSQWGAPLMFTYLADVLIYLGFGITMAACLWYVDGSLKDDAD
jgi:hypothetical protein